MTETIIHTLPRTILATASALIGEYVLELITTGLALAKLGAVSPVRAHNVNVAGLYRIWVFAPDIARVTRWNKVRRIVILLPTIKVVDHQRTLCCSFALKPVNGGSTPVTWVWSRPNLFIKDKSMFPDAPIPISQDMPMSRNYRVKTWTTGAARLPIKLPGACIGTKASPSIFKLRRVCAKALAATLAGSVNHMPIIA